MMALLLDGFDEFLGGLGYENALGSLGSWVEELGGRGALVVSARSSYYLNQYRSSLTMPRNQALSVAHRVARVQKWDDDQVAKFLEHFGVDATAWQSLDADDRDLTRLPFFGRVYAEAEMRRMTGAGEPGNFTSLPERIVDQYLSREEMKLLAPEDQGLLITIDELRRTFEALADLMATENEREVDIADLQYAVQIAITPDSLEGRPGLVHRLSVLCTLAVNPAAGTVQRFHFQHELFYDFFFAESILRDLRVGSLTVVHGTFSRSPWRIATIARIAKIAPTELRSLIAFSRSARAEVPAERLPVLRANTGLAWSCLIRSLERLEGEVVEDATFGDLELTGAHLSGLRLLRCRFQRLGIAPVGGWSLTLDDCVIDTLHIHGANPNLEGLAGVASSSVSVLITQTSLLETPLEIEESLRAMGAPLPPSESQTKTSQTVAAAAFFLRKIANRADSVVIFKSSYLPASDYSGWQLRLGNQSWIDFVKALHDSRLVELVPVQMSGASKYRVKFLIAVSGILGRELNIPQVADFWTRVGEDFEKGLAE